ncbi:hypothetical protein KQX54_020132 [Cotesia glomerata]|uniref:Uncharacterized protein n=1 Tax=Cotesia glomerata TaxID=32391 RepID=A0AAV7IHM4_COTGL|nr:hypothetical protein KQX54_020132 [Cotesia glomerata]
MCIKDRKSIKAPKQANKPTEEQHQLELNNHTLYKVQTSDAAAAEAAYGTLHYITLHYIALPDCSYLQCWQPEPDLAVGGTRQAHSQPADVDGIR